MKIIPEREPDIKCGILSIWVLHLQFPEATDYWDGGWLDVVAHCSDHGASVTVSGSILHIGEIRTWMDELLKMDDTLQGTASLPTIEPNLAVSLECNERGQITGKCQITPDNLRQIHEFIFDIDQSYIKGIVSQCRTVLRTYERCDYQEKK